MKRFEYITDESYLNDNVFKYFFSDVKSIYHRQLNSILKKSSSDQYRLRNDVIERVFIIPQIFLKSHDVKYAFITFMTPKDYLKYMVLLLYYLNGKEEYQYVFYEIKNIINKNMNDVDMTKWMREFAKLGDLSKQTYDEFERRRLIRFYKYRKLDSFMNKYKTIRKYSCHE